jgi:hypothetical protein
MAAMTGHGRSNGQTPGRRTATVIAAAVLTLLACAVSVPPSGGPEDRTPPRIRFSVPRPDSTGVDVSSPIRLGFSEPMARERVERNVSTAPPIRIRRVRWQGEVLSIEPEGGLLRDTTYVVRVRPGYRDRHGVASTEWHEFAFATAAAIDTARIEGTVWLRRQPAKAIVRGFRVTGADTIDPEAARPDRETATGEDGRYALRYLPSNDARFRVMAFVDQNANGAYDRGVEPVVVWPDTVVLSPHSPVVSRLNLNAVDRGEPGSVRGVVVNETGIDTARVVAALFSGEDSTRAIHVAVCDTGGGYEFGQVKPGTYVLRGFVDARADSVQGEWPCAGAATPCREPGARLSTPVVVRPGESTAAPALVIRRREER